MRRMQAKVRDYLQGRNKTARDIVGCTQEELREKLQPPEHVLKWHLSYIRHPREFNLESPDELARCFHYSNMVAKPTKVSRPP
jgi:hypothetical protein